MDYSRLHNWSTITVDEVDLAPGAYKPKRTRFVCAEYNGIAECATCGFYGSPSAFPERSSRLSVLADRPDVLPMKIGVLGWKLTCPRCGNTFNQHLPDKDPDYMMTRRCRAHIENSCTRPWLTADAIAAEVGIDPVTVQKIRRALIRDRDIGYRFATPFVLGIDEKKIAGHMRLTLTAIPLDGDGKVELIDVLVDQTGRTLRNWLLARPDRDLIRYVAMDGWKGYRAVAREVLPGATIVFDRFHLQNYLLKPKNSVSTRKAALAAIAILDIRHDPDLADLAWTEWEAGLTSAECDGLSTFLRIFREHRDEVIEYARTGITNSGTEQKNGTLALRVWLGRNSCWRTVRGLALFHNTSTHAGRYFRCCDCGGYFEEAFVSLSGSAYAHRGTDIVRSHAYVSREYDGDQVHLALSYTCEDCGKKADKNDDTPEIDPAVRSGFQEAMPDAALGHSTAIRPVLPPQSVDEWNRVVEGYVAWEAFWQGPRDRSGLSMGEADRLSSEATAPPT